MAGSDHPDLAERRSGADRRKRVVSALHHLKEPSTWAGFGLIASAIGWSGALPALVPQLVMAIAGILAVVLCERP